MPDPLEKVLTLHGLGMVKGGEEEKLLMFLQTHHPEKNWSNHIFEELEWDNTTWTQPSIEEAPELELKTLPVNMKYVFLHPFLFSCDYLCVFNKDYAKTNLRVLATKKRLLDGP